MIDSTPADLILILCEQELRDARFSDQEKTLPEPHAAFLISELKDMQEEMHTRLPMMAIWRIDGLLAYLGRHSGRRQVEPLTEVAAKWAASLHEASEQGELGPDGRMSKSEALRRVTEVYLRVERPDSEEPDPWGKAYDAIRKAGDRLKR